MKKYTKVGNLDEKQINIVNRKLNPTLRKCRSISFKSSVCVLYPPRWKYLSKVPSFIQQKHRVRFLDLNLDFQA